MNRIIAKEMLAGALPEDLRGDIDPEHRVLVTVAEVAPAASVTGDAPGQSAAAVHAELTATLERYGLLGARRDGPRPSLTELFDRRPRTGHITIDEAVARVRALRDEWDD
ncbi:hypothetical protein [Methylobrevis albus]|uniref:Uncharacterized protein n=1 Tax=Methylobrevis albus TaxID=2793297 RepID=A0A931N0F3_9HYPH|nr:hypothetical protein [Methylobrevis albus]MBH0238736.1 hypothetical protein [Methylobrevis albus]